MTRKRYTAEQIIEGGSPPSAELKNIDNPADNTAIILCGSDLFDFVAEAAISLTIVYLIAKTFNLPSFEEVKHIFFN